jgi:hypothetical protein
MKNTLEFLNCPKCGEEFTEVNGLYVWCKPCGHIDDSNFEQIVNSSLLSSNGTGKEET